jgi:prepilin peptidase CpaA
MLFGMNITVQDVSFAATVILILVAGYTDCRRRLIENQLTLPAVVIGFILNSIGHGWQGILLSCLGLLTGAGMFMPFYLFGRLGAGDVKLMAAIGALLGSYPALNVALYSMLAGGVLAIAISILNKNLESTIIKVKRLFKCSFRRVTPGGESKDGIQPGNTMPYGLAIGAGTLSFFMFGAIV